ncbi:sensor domain-containing diguanylate cyclase [Amphritea balenae]|nr:sensor domain-containing diguanylate cyclase [Amphritea balenae]GGK57088.1 hypothetical protein GCM10007941_04060 [Amphritea balenae]
MMRNLKLRKSPLHVRLILLLGPLAALILAFQIELYQLEQNFGRQVDAATYEISTKVNAFEVALEGFANFLAVSEKTNDKAIRAYTQGVMEVFPELYMFEIASYVSKTERRSFEKMMHYKGYFNFRIHAFDYDNSRQIIAIPEQDYYYPIRFIEPETAETEAVLGLDMARTSDVLIATMMQSLSAPRPIASRPFTFLEGGKGYVMYRPVVQPVSNNSVKHQITNPDFAMLVIRGNDLLPAWLKESRDYRVTLSYTTIHAEDVAEALIDPVRTDNQSFVLQTYSRTVQIDNESQPFRLMIEKDINLYSFNWINIFGVLLIGIVFSSYIGFGLNLSHRRKIQAEKERERLYNQANYDVLTKLPNINLLMDRADRAILMAKRSGSSVAICYLDIDRFKRINDRWGHQAGDDLLSQLADRLQRVLRAEDTVARIHGDEFVVLLPKITNDKVLGQVQNKIMSVFDQPFTVANNSIQVKGSFGTATFPRDGTTLEQLLNTSDRQMYIHKKQNKEHQAEEKAFEQI